MSQVRPLKNMNSWSSIEYETVNLQIKYKDAIKNCRGNEISGPSKNALGFF